MKKILLIIIGLILLVVGVSIMIPNFLQGHFTVATWGTLIIVVGIFLFGLAFSVKS